MKLLTRILLLIAALATPVFLLTVYLPASGKYTPIVGWYLFGSWLFSVVVLATYITLAVKNPRLLRREKILWVLFLIVGNTLAQLMYWFMYLWPNRKGGLHPIHGKF